MTTAVQGWVKTFLLNHGQVKHLTSIFITSPKKGDVTKCTNCTTALFPHANKILLKTIQMQLELYIGYEMPMEQAGLRKGHGTRANIANVNVSWTAQGSTIKMSNCLIDYTKGFDSVQHLKMWNSIRNLGITKHSTVLI
jgi:hypothetical protein